MDRIELLRSMASRLEAALLELQSVAHDARTTGLALDGLNDILARLVAVRDALAALAAELTRGGG